MRTANPVLSERIFERYLQEEGVRCEWLPIWRKFPIAI